MIRDFPVEPPPPRRRGSGRHGRGGSAGKTALLIGGAVMTLVLLAALVVWLAPGEGPAGANDSSSPDPDDSQSDDPNTVTLTGVGDTIMGVLPDELPPNNAADYFDGVSEELAGDVVFGNLEGPLSTRDEFRKCGEAPGEPEDPECFYIRMPPEYASVLADAGFNVMSIANNHAYDAGPDGHADTQQNLTDAGLVASGVKGEISEIEVKGFKVAVVSTAAYDFYTNALDLEAVSALVSAAAEQADLVVFSMHVGAEGDDARHVPGETEEYHGEVRGDSAAVSHAAVDAGADVVFGHGPHVIRGMEYYNGRLIAHSLGNFAGYGVLQTEGALGRGAILQVTLNPEGEWVSGRVVATRMVDDGFPASHPEIDPDGGAYDDVNELSAADFGDAAASVDDDGALNGP